MEAKAAAKEVDEIDALNASLEAVDAKVKLVSGNAQQANAPTPPPSPLRKCSMALAGRCTLL